MRGMCGKCDKRDTCTELCQEAEEYASQDYTPIEEGLVYLNIENYDRYDAFGHDKRNSVNLDSPAILRGIIIALHLDGKNKKDIARYVPCSRRYVREIIWKFNMKRMNESGSKLKKDIE